MLQSVTHGSPSWLFSEDFAPQDVGKERGARCCFQRGITLPEQSAQAQSAIFECVWCAQTTRAMYCACWRAEFLRRSTHACIERALRPPCTAVVMSVSAWPFQPGDARASAHCRKFQDFMNFWKHVPAIASRPIVANPISGHQIVSADGAVVEEHQTHRQVPLGSAEKWSGSSHGRMATAVGRFSPTVIGVVTWRHGNHRMEASSRWESIMA